jgi:hypothetical protein
MNSHMTHTLRRSTRRPSSEGHVRAAVLRMQRAGRPLDGEYGAIEVAELEARVAAL